MRDENLYAFKQHYMFILAMIEAVALILSTSRCFVFWCDQGLAIKVATRKQAESIYFAGNKLRTANACNCNAWCRAIPSSALTSLSTQA